MRFLALPASICLALPGLAFGADSPTDRCAGLYSLSDADHAVESGVLVSATGDTPAHCRVRGTIDGTIRFEIRMPAEGWTGRFMFHAPGGLAGVVGDTSSLLDDGFAMATTDTGHEPENDPSFYRDDHAKLNFAFRANHLTTVLSKRVIQGVLRPAGAARVPVGLLQRRACGAGGGVALSGRLRRHHRRGAGNRLRAWPAGMGAGGDPAPGPQPPYPGVRGAAGGQHQESLRPARRRCRRSGRGSPKVHGRTARTRRSGVPERSSRRLPHGGPDRDGPLRVHRDYRRVGRRRGAGGLSRRGTGRRLRALGDRSRALPRGDGVRHDGRSAGGRDAPQTGFQHRDLRPGEGP